MGVRRSKSSAGPAAPRTDSALAERCQRLEDLLRRALAGRRRAAMERDRAIARIRAVGDDFVSAFEAIDARTEAAIAAAELRGLLGHDLDVDSLLTLSTEHLVARYRPANVAIWLCDSRNNHSLVAYGANGTPRGRAEATMGSSAARRAPACRSRAPPGPSTVPRTSCARPRPVAACWSASARCSRRSPAAASASAPSCSSSLPTSRGPRTRRSSLRRSPP